MSKVMHSSTACAGQAHSPAAAGEQCAMWRRWHKNARNEKYGKPKLTMYVVCWLV